MRTAQLQHHDLRAVALNRDMDVTERDVLLTYLPVGLNWGYITLMQTIMAGARPF